jgi:hypothetical protein
MGLIDRVKWWGPCLKGENKLHSMLGDLASLCTRRPGPAPESPRNTTPYGGRYRREAHCAAINEYIVVPR